MHKPPFSECQPLFSEHKLSINQAKITSTLLINKPSSTELNRGLQRLSLETETSAEFNQVKPRLDKINQEIN